MTPTLPDPPPLRIRRRFVGPGHPTYIVAEISANHAQKLDRAIALVQAAREVGADAVKLQTYTPDTLTIDSDQPWFRIGPGTLWEGNTLYRLYGEAYTPWEWHPQLKQTAEALGLDCFSTPFDASAVDFLERLDVPCHKIASFELVDIPLIRRIAKTGRPIIMSTGMATLEEIQEAVDVARTAGCAQLALLKCTSAYPAPPEDMNLIAIRDLTARFGVPVGLSDHTLGIAVPVAAVALGACIIEKHFTMARSDGGPDAAFSLEPSEFHEMVKAIRVAERAIGRPVYQITEAESASRAFRKSLFITVDVRAGERFTPDNVRCIRPAHGLHPRHLERVLGARAARDIPRGTPLAWDMVS